MCGESEEGEEMAMMGLARAEQIQSEGHWVKLWRLCRGMGRRRTKRRRLQRQRIAAGEEEEAGELIHDLERWGRWRWWTGGCLHLCISQLERMLFSDGNGVNDQRSVCTVLAVRAVGGGRAAPTT